jgi:cholesterol oxidase
VRTQLEPLGLIDPNVQLANDIDVVVGCGLGGTSLINAGISLRPEADVFLQAEWPNAIRAEHTSGSLWQFYSRAEQMLGTRRESSILELEKVKTHESLVRSRGVAHDANPLNITREPHARHGALQVACTHCGDWIAGCNVGAKNTLVTNYLPFAKQCGARIFTEIEVRTIAREKDDWIVEFVVPRGPLQSTKKGSVRAPIVVLGAGSMGSTEILLRSREIGFSKHLGERFSANADIMGMSYNGERRTDVLAYGAHASEWRVGPSIASHGDYRRGGPLELRFLLLEGVIPSALQTSVGRAFGAWAMVGAGLTSEQKQRIAKDLAGAPPRDGALNHSLLFLACGHDSARGKYVLKDEDDRVVIEWPEVGREPAFARITEEMEALARAHGGVFVPNPRSTLFGGSRQMTVHPLGGCPMADDVDRGVVDDHGRVFANDGIHRGLYVTDGAIIPRSLGVTPLLTISALAERATEAMIEDAKRTS